MTLYCGEKVSLRKGREDDGGRRRRGDVFPHRKRYGRDAKGFAPVCDGASMPGINASEWQERPPNGDDDRLVVIFHPPQPPRWRAGRKSRLRGVVLIHLTLQFCAHNLPTTVSSHGRCAVQPQSRNFNPLSHIALTLGIPDRELFLRSS